MRASSWISLRTSAEQGMKSSCNCSAPAIWRNSMARFSSSSLTANGAISGLITPASSLEISTSVPSRFSTSSSELLILRISRRWTRRLLQQSAGEQPRGIERCSRSWLTAARNLVFDRLANSASRLASRNRASAWLRSSISRNSWSLRLVSSAVRSRTRCSVLVGLMQRLGGAPAVGDVLDQHEDAGHFAVGLPVRHVGSQRSAAGRHGCARPSRS